MVFFWGGGQSFSVENDSIVRCILGHVTKIEPDYRVALMIDLASEIESVTAQSMRVFAVKPCLSIALKYHHDIL